MSLKKSTTVSIFQLAAVGIAVVAALLGVYGMLSGERMIVPGGATPFDQVLKGTEQYFGSFGLIGVLAGIALILLGHNDKTKTLPNHPELEELED